MVSSSFGNFEMLLSILSGFSLSLSLSLSLSVSLFLSRFPAGTLQTKCTQQVIKMALELCVFWSVGNT